MRKFFDGDGSDSTTAVKNLLESRSNFNVADLVLIGQPEDPLAWWLTNYNTPLSWPVWTNEKASGGRGIANAFSPAVIRRGTTSFKVGLEVSTLSFEWSPPLGSFTSAIQNANPYQLGQTSFFDNMNFRLWECIMITPGDANTYGACEMFAGTIGNVDVKRNKITFTVNSLLAVMNEMVPSNIIQTSAQLAAYQAGTPPYDNSGDILPSVPLFTAEAGSTQTKLVGFDTNVPSAGYQFNAGVLVPGYVVFKPGSSLASGNNVYWSAILGNQPIPATSNNEIILYSSLPWAPVAGVDQFYVFADPPQSNNGEFLYVPSPATGI